MSEERELQTRDQARPAGGVSRRRLLGGGAAALGASVGAGFLARHTASGVPAERAQRPSQRLSVLSGEEAASVGAMADRVFPAGAGSAGATAMGVVTYIDRQLAGEWGGGARLYRQGPFFEAQDSGHGYQLPMTPRELYKHVLPRIADHTAARYAKRIEQLDADRQDEVLTELEAGTVELGLRQGPHGFTSADFFTFFLANVREGLFSDPLYGGNQDVQGWRWVGFPGDPMAHSDDYFGFFSSWHVAYDVEPRGLDATVAERRHAG
jgi:gluconate 2-dehydrogenase gamma chain